MWGKWESGNIMMFIVLLMMNLNVKKIEITGDMRVCMCYWWNSMLKVDSEEKRYRQKKR